MLLLLVQRASTMQRSGRPPLAPSNPLDAQGRRASGSLQSLPAEACTLARADSTASSLAAEVGLEGSRALCSWHALTGAPAGFQPCLRSTLLP